MTLQEAYQQYIFTKEAWDKLLVDRFGEHAGHARYELRGRGICSVITGGADVELKEAFAAHSMAFYAWDSLRVLSRPTAITQTDKDLLAMALPFVEYAESDPAYKPGTVAKVSAQIRAAIEGEIQ